MGDDKPATIAILGGTQEWRAVRACAGLTLPADVPEGALADAVKRLRELIDAYDSRNLEMNSPEIDLPSEDGCAPWHEMWLSYARAALAALGAK